jgi:hypothetical protein
VFLLAGSARPCACPAGPGRSAARIARSAGPGRSRCSAC